tara:strand:- start:707 stop:1399 length:693 start_codon:yes stop_codon:yes gene_type:complete
MYIPKSFMVVTPHPDDAELGCGGTISKWISEGAHGVLLVCTNGDKGSTEPDMTSRQLADIRRVEQEKASEILGLKNVISFKYPDGELEDSNEFRERVVKNIRKYQPEVVLCTDPVRQNFYIHRDHRITGQVVIDAIYPYARDRLYYPRHEEEGILAHKVKDILFWGSENPNEIVNITEHIDMKIAALKQHSSQLSDGDSVGLRLKETAIRAASGQDYQYGETFRRISFRS